ncbi:DNA replication factor C complex subunit Rfc1 [Coemansia thaxteri]|uniref:Replication factor C subunit 1 n=1 Tax=Coemansia thaxteri TaxID=2663907 RepID=A0A9W8EJ91_9FUNG|nr:DNA replication factor C complex subunit Rfc1 [Coemansia thaxteri]KAJ2008892.1 DNA replication factor C complex subunit Rfc1 [Coemansia thaxteri]KAJ2473752.1 DNA replication factor C complex subunit Rfc1 [Coemansia sp. RSA 2322]KAJ2487240.1 DNA replication factor C complex subunit Rfc1 [Coemansia sp. RSA 2320]
MPRTAAAMPAKRKVADLDDDEEEEINPEEFFGKSKSPNKTKAKAAGVTAKSEHAADKQLMDVDGSEGTKSAHAVGFSATDLPNIQPKKFNYAAIKQHQGAKDPGSKATPVGAPNCLGSLKFVVTGEFTSLTREQITDLIKTYGGQVTSAVSGKTSYLVVGDDPGSTKVGKAKKLNTPYLREDDLFELIRASNHDEPAASSSKPEPKHAPETEDVTEPEPEPATEPEYITEPETTQIAAAAPQPVARPAPAANADQPLSSKLSVASLEPALPASTSARAPVSDLWTERYKPTKLKDLCGHKNSATEIVAWLGVWAAGSIPETRAVLISGPPGIGKTTTAHLVAKLAGFDVLELNASETRSKSTLKDVLGSAIGNRSVLEFDRRALQKLETDQEQQQAEDADVRNAVSTSGAKRLVVIMDEVDGMSGGDRGGSAELIQMIKRTRVPIICICNDRQSTKVRSLANYCKDMRFRRPSEQMVKSRLNTIAFREGLKLDPNTIGQLMQSTHNDIRQVINLMSSYSLNKSTMSYMDSKAYTALNKKETAIGPFDVIGKYMNASENSGLSFSEKLDLYYSDFSITPLFVQENYIDNTPARCQNGLELLDRLSQAADLIAEADLVENKLRGSQQWGLMPLHAALSCVGPAFHVRGNHNGMYRFPGWLGQNSKGGKLSRMLRDVQCHMRLRVSADKTEVRKSYIPAMVPELVTPLVKQGTAGIGDVMSTMDHYYLSKDHWDAMLELHLDGEQLLKQVPTAVKSAFTREYTKSSHPIAFNALAGVETGRAAAAAAAGASLKPDTEDVIDDDDDGGAVNGDDEESEDASGDSLGDDAMIKEVKPKKAAAASKAASNGRGRGRGGKAAASSSAAQPRKKRKVED